MLDRLTRLGYAGVARAARALVSIVPAHASSKLGRTFAARRNLIQRYHEWGATGRDRARPLLWMHAPSVGEGLQARPVLERLRRRSPELQFAYTHFSPSAERFAAGLDVDFRAYLPFDVDEDCALALDALRPDALVFSKLDVWPALVRAAAARGVALGLISATVSPGSGRRGLAARMLRDAYARLDRVGAVDEEDADRLEQLGVRASVLEITGDTRYDQVWERAQRSEAAHRARGSSGTRVPTLVAGSTWPSDEKRLLASWLAIRVRVPSARLIIAPHEPTAAHLEPIERWAREHGLRLVRSSTAGADAEANVVLVDRTGMLGDLYVLGHLAYVGGGFHAAGLHSVLEPAAYGQPVVFGPRHRDSRDARLLLAAGGGATVACESDMIDVVSRWLTDAPRRIEAGMAARDVVRQGLGAADRTTELVSRLLGT